VREKREGERERGEARVTCGIQGLWLAARISNIGGYVEKHFRKVYRILRHRLGKEFSLGHSHN
jgi:hypothetical protein